MTNSEDLKALVAELRDRAGQPGPYGLRSPDLQLLVRAADVLEARIAVPDREVVADTLQAAVVAISMRDPFRLKLFRSEALILADAIIAMLSAAPGDGGGELGLSQGRGDARLDSQAANQSQQGGEP